MKLNVCDLVPGFPSPASPSGRGRGCDAGPGSGEARRGERSSPTSSFDEVARGTAAEDRRPADSPGVREGQESAPVREGTEAARQEQAAAGPSRPAMPVLWSEALLQPLSETQGASAPGTVPAGLPSALQASPDTGALPGTASASAGTHTPQPQVPNGIQGPALSAEDPASAASTDNKPTTPALTADSIRAESSGGTTGRAGDPGPAARESATGPIPADLEPSDLPRGPGMSPEERGAQSRENPPDPTDPGTLPTSTRKGPQPALEPAAADARKVDAAAPETVMAQGAGKASGPDDAGRHAEPPLRVQAGSWPPSTEAKPGDPAHTPAEFKGAFDASGKTAYLKIQDQGLGAMQWHLRMEGGRLAAEAVVQSARIQEVFHANQDVLQARLNELGVELEGFEVSVDQGSQGFLGRGLHKGAVPEVQGRGQDANPGTFIERVQANVTARARGGVDLYA